MMMRPGDILGRIFYVVTEINHRIIGIYPRSTRRTRIIGILSTEHTEDTELFWKLLRKKSLGEIFNKNMAYGQK
ncbi:hypothetical protein CIK96_11585 [Prevotella sp. P4-98]|nr:hypothetical protein CIK96_11585 [Prevotella sp. P4-98]